MEEQLISFETAKLAKEKGYNKRSEYCFAETYAHDYECHHTGNEYTSEYKGPRLLYSEYIGEHDNVICNAPPQHVLQKWLREIHGIHIVIIPTVTSFWTYKTVTVISERDNDVIKGIKSVSDLPPYKEVCGYDFNTYEDALEDALFESLKLITNNYGLHIL